MTQINGLKFQVEQTHLQNLKKAEQALGTEVTGPSFSERIATWLKDVAGAQNDAAKLAQDYELAL